LPHSDIRGSKLVRSSPRLFAAYHVLHSLRVPRHPPNALKALDRSHFQCPPVRGLAPGWKRVLRDERTAFSDPSPSRRWIRKTCSTPEGGKQVLERPVSHENCPLAARVTRRRLSPAPHRGVRTTLLFTMSSRPRGPAKSENRSQPPEFPPAPRSEFWLLISSLVWRRCAEKRAKSAFALRAPARQPSPKNRRPCRAEAAERQRLVEPDGIEPTTSCLQSRRSPN
jgi:hypothetical protein